MDTADFLSRLTGVKSRGGGKYIACCPAHNDRDPSLSLYFHHDGRILIHCFAGCSSIEVLSAIGLSLRDLYEQPLENYLHGGNKRRQEKHKERELDHYRTMLEIAKEMRRKGEKLTPAMLREERQAYWRLRNAEE